MRLVELPVVEIAEREPNMPESLDYRAQLLSCLKFPIEGLTIDMMEVPLRIIPKLKAGNGSARLEEDEHKYLCDLLSRTQFRFVIPEIVAMRDAIKNAPKVDL